MSVTDGLNRHFEFAISSKTEREFYEYVYYYFDFIHKTPMLLQVFEDAQREYSRKHGEIWEKNRYETEEELDHRSDLTGKMEFFDMFSIAASMYVRIYLKVDDYKNTLEPDSHQDPMAVALIKGPDHAANEAFKRYPERGKSYKKEIHQHYKSWYEGKREFYERDLRGFHFALLNVMATPVEKKPGDPYFTFDVNTGNFNYGEINGNLPLGGQEYKVFSFLYKAKQQTATFAELINTYKHVDGATKPHKQDLYIIVRNIKQRFGILPVSKTSMPDFIFNIKEFGYKLALKE